MTCIVGLQYNDSSYMIADSQCTVSPHSKFNISEAESKIVQGNKFVVGVAGDYIINTLLREKSIDGLFTKGVSLDSLINIKHYLDVFDTIPEFELLIISYEYDIPTVYTVDSSFCITEHMDIVETLDNTIKYTAIGSGQIEAKSFLAGVFKYIDIDTLDNGQIEAILKDTIEHVSKVNTTVSLPTSLYTEA